MYLYLHFTDGYLPQIDKTGATNVEKSYGTLRTFMGFDPIKLVTKLHQEKLLIYGIVAL